MVRSTPMVLLGALLLSASACQFAAFFGLESRAARIDRLLGSLAADSMAGRAVGTLGSNMAARLIATEFDAAGVAPAWTSGYIQEIAAARLRLPGGGTRVVTAEAADRFPDSAKEFFSDRNVVGIVPGSDPTVSDEAIVVGAHFDHVGVGRPVDGDSIYNGADDDASGVVAVLEAARDLASGTPPRRTVVFVLFTGEEVGGLGSRWYLDHPAVPLDQTVAQLQVEMIGRPDSLAGGPGMLWATGFDRSTVAEILSAREVPVVADPHPDENFFFRSDNVRFAYHGIPAHTLSSFNLHSDYHRPSDEVGLVDLDHLVAAVETVIMAVRALADAPNAPAWNEGGQPEQIAR